MCLAVLSLWVLARALVEASCASRRGLRRYVQLLSSMDEIESGFVRAQKGTEEILRYREIAESHQVPIKKEDQVAVSAARSRAACREGACLSSALHKKTFVRTREVGPGVGKGRRR